MPGASNTLILANSSSDVPILCRCACPLMARVAEKCPRRLCETARSLLTQGCFDLMVCLVAEAIRWNSPLQVDPEPSERIQFEVLRSPAVSSAAPNPLGRGIASPLLARAPRTNRTRNGIPALAVGCGVRYPVSWNQVNPIRSAKFNASTRRSGRRYAEAARFRAIFPPASRE